VRLERLQLRGFSSAFPGVVDLQLRELPAGLVAVVGANGQGKTSLLETAPAAIYRQLPARNNADPIDLATGRDSFLDLEYSVEGLGAFRARLNLDGPKGLTDAVLEVILPDGAHAALNDGKRSTFDAVIKSRFPSFDLFINSAFAAQGRGDEFVRRKPSARKDLFTEFLALQDLLRMAAAAGEAAELAADARLRLTAQIEALERDTTPAILEALDDRSKQLEVQGGSADIRKRELATAITDLETRSQLAADQVAAYAGAQDRMTRIVTELVRRRTEIEVLGVKEIELTRATSTEAGAITRRLDDVNRDVETRIAGNQKLQGMGSSIRAAVASVKVIDGKLVEAREQHAAAAAEQDAAARELSDRERAVSAFTKPTTELERARTDAGLLNTVPCHGAGEYAACQLLVNAQQAKDRIDALTAQVAGIAEAITRRDAAIDRRARAMKRTGELAERIAALGKDRAGHQELTKYETALVEAETRVAELTTKRTEAQAEAARQIFQLEASHEARLTELRTEKANLHTLVAQFEQEQRTAQQDLQAATADNRQGMALLEQLAAARKDYEAVITTLATVTSGHQELARRREELQVKLLRVELLRARRAHVEQELVEWKDLAKALGKGGLPDLEIDAAGPTISARTNELLLACVGPRFSVELVTQVEKADGSGMRDQFTVRVFDNDTGRWHDDISALSGGERVIVQEALMCAISLFVNERSPMPIRTLWRDETGAALDPENAIRYVQMLRKVRELGGYHHVYFISHNADAAALADVQIQVGGGTARIVLPPFSRQEVAA
jgi:exonuclease SbcC